MQESQEPEPPVNKFPKTSMMMAGTAAAFALGGWIPAIGVAAAQYAAYKWSKK